MSHPFSICAGPGYGDSKLDPACQEPDSDGCPLCGWPWEKCDCPDREENA